MGDWEDDDFEVDVKQLDEKGLTVFEEVPEEKTVKRVTPKNRTKPTKLGNNGRLQAFTNDLSRELTELEKEQMQKQSDLLLAKELFGIEGDEALSYGELESLEDFRAYGEKLGAKLITRSNATHFPDFVQTLMKVIVSNLDANKARYLSTIVKTLADEKTASEKETKTKRAAAKPTIKLAQKSAASAKSKKNLYDDYVADEYDDFADDFM